MLRKSSPLPGAILLCTFYPCIGLDCVTPVVNIGGRTANHARLADAKPVNEKPGDGSLNTSLSELVALGTMVGVVALALQASSRGTGSIRLIHCLQGIQA